MKKAFFFLFFFVCGISLVCAQQYPKPLLRGDYPDPSLIRDGKDYYMTHSPFVYAPGFLIWHSTDLINWEPVCRAMPENVGSAMAPDLVKYKGRYYIYYPSAGTNWVIWADDIRGPWSKPIDLKVNLIDPGHVVGQDGKRYLYVSDGWMTELSDDGLSAVGEKQKVYDGWRYPKSWDTECMCLESPKLNYKDGYYYLTSAQGGTAGPATSHMVVVARSESPVGPWENSPYNPIVHTYDAAEQWWSKGHGTLIDDVNGNWWIVYHAYEKGEYPLGRQTLIEPIEWTEDGWCRAAANPVALPGGDVPGKPIVISDRFEENTLGWQWTSWRKYDPRNVMLKKRALYLKGKGATPQNAELLLTTPMDPSYEVETELTVGFDNVGGLLLFYTEKAYAGITTDGKDFILYTQAGQSVTVPSTYGKHLFLKIVNRHYCCDFLASKDGKDWQMIKSGVDVSEFHHNAYFGFFALRPALYSAGKGEARFNFFEYVPLPCVVACDSERIAVKEGVKAPKPVFRDPVYDGAADPVVIWNSQVKKWWMFYTNRRANQSKLPGVSWVFGSPLGIAESADGVNWTYVGTARFPDLPAEYGGKNATFWAPDITWGDDGKWHMYLSARPGIAEHWGGVKGGFIGHLTSTNLRDWMHESELSQVGTESIDADILQMPDGNWRMYYKNSTPYSRLCMIQSKDLSTWSEPVEVMKISGEGPAVFRWKDYFWMLVDTWNGQTVFRSNDADHWEKQPGGTLLPDEEGTGRDDTPNALHANVVIHKNRAYLYYFTHPGRIGDSKKKDSYEQRRTSIQVVELKMSPEGWLTANRNEPTYVGMD